MNLIIVLFLSIVVSVNTILSCPNSTRIIIKDRDFKPIELKYFYTNAFFEKEGNHYYVAGNLHGALERALIEKFEPITGSIWTRFYPDSFVFNKLYVTKDYVFAVGCVSDDAATKNKLAFLIIVNATTSTVLRHYIAENYCYNSIVANNKYYFITGTKYSEILNITHAFVSKYELRSGHQVYEQLFGQNSFIQRCENKGTNLVMISDDEIIVTMTIKEYSCESHIVNLKGLTSKWLVKLIPFSYSEATAVSIYKDLVAVGGRFTFNILIVNNSVRLVANGLGRDSFLITMNRHSGKIMHYGSLCDVSDISALYINNCSFVISGKKKNAQNKVYLASGNFDIIDRERNTYYINETIIDSSLNSQMYIENDYITTIIGNTSTCVNLERYVLKNII